MAITILIIALIILVPAGVAVGYGLGKKKQIAEKVSGAVEKYSDKVSEAVKDASEKI